LLAATLAAVGDAYPALTLRARGVGMSDDAPVSPVPAPAPICRGGVVCGDKVASAPGTRADDNDAGEARLDSLDADADVESVRPGSEMLVFFNVTGRFSNDQFSPFDLQPSLSIFL
jgi:hypothetical protein